MQVAFFKCYVCYNSLRKIQSLNLTLIGLKYCEKKFCWSSKFPTAYQFTHLMTGLFEELQPSVINLILSISYIFCYRAFYSRIIAFKYIFL